MAEKSCGNCKHCRSLIPVHENAPSQWVCDELYGEDRSVNVSPPYDEACEKWEEEIENGN